MKYLLTVAENVSRVPLAPLPLLTVSVCASWNVPETLLAYKKSAPTYVTVAVAPDTLPVTVLPTAKVPVTLERPNLALDCTVTV